MYTSFVRANSGDCFDITYLYQKLVYWKKIAVQIAILLKKFSKFTPEISSQDTHTARSAKEKFEEYHVFQYHNYYIIQVSHIK